MKRIACPHCGFLNFEISAYCGRCERPLKKIEETAKPKQVESQIKPVADIAEPLSKKEIATQSHSMLKPQRPKIEETPPSQSDPAVLQRIAPPPLPIEITTQPKNAIVSERAQSVTPDLPNMRVSTAALNETMVDQGYEATKHTAGETMVNIAPLFLAWVGKSLDALLALLFAVMVVQMTHAFEMFTWQKASSSGMLDTVVSWMSLNSQAAVQVFFVAVGFGLLHNLVATFFQGQTIGRKLTNTFLIQHSGTPTHTGQALSAKTMMLRSIASMVSLVAFGAGFFWLLVDTRHRTWHDMFSKTLLVQFTLKK